LGTGCIFGAQIYPETYGSLLFVLAPGAFIALGLLIALFTKIRTKNA
ncbi:MAG: electron transport complex subunit RsxE, partial [Duncaniella sp.]|nr:electron transport complex subunit RsxE [Duncaniella sp.]